MARRKNVKRIDPRYFLNETVNRNDDGSRLEEGVLDAVGDMVSRTGLAGAKAKKNVFWRKKGKSRYESKIDDTPHATNWDFREFFEDGDEYDASYRGIGRAWDDYLATVVKPKQRAGKKANDAYERKKQRESDAAERAKQQAREDREEAEREAYRNSPEGRDKARRDAEIQADRDKKARVRAAAAARKERERESGGTGSWTDVFDFSHQLEEGEMISEAEGPKQALSRWAQMFPDAASALETAGATLSDILQALGKDTYDPEMGLDTRGEVERSAQPRSADQTSQGRPSGFPHKFEE